MNLLITGGLGGMGSELVQALAADSHARVISVSRRALPVDRHLPSNVMHESGPVLDEAFLHDVMHRHAITHVIHAAGARTRECESRPEIAFEANVLATDRVLCAASTAGTVRRFIHLSSAAVYGGKEHAITENEPLSPVGYYAITKAASELAVRYRLSGTSMQAVILRPGFIIGKQTSGSLSDFLRLAAQGQNATLHHPDHFHLHWAPDLARAIIHLLHANLPDQVNVYHPPGRDCSLHELAHLMPEQRKAIQAHHNTTLPQRLDGSKYRRELPTFELTGCPEIMYQLQNSTHPTLPSL